MPKEADPYYTRSQVPTEFIEHVGPTGLSVGEEGQNRERKYSSQGDDIRKFSNKSATKGWHPTADPYYGRKAVPDSLIQGVGETGLSKEEEYINRERKFSVNGVDVRKFGSTSSSGFHPSDDPFYGRKAVDKTEIEGVGETNMSKAEEFEVRENKAHLFGESADPFEIVTGKGHRGSVSAAASVGAADARRRSSAVAPDHAHAAAQATKAYNSGHHGDTLGRIDSRQEDDVIRPSTEGHHPTTTTTTTTTNTTTHVGGGDAGHTQFYNDATRDLDGVAPHEKA